MLHYREFSCLRRNSESFEVFVARYQALAEDNALQGFGTADAQWDYLAMQGYLDI